MKTIINHLKKKKKKKKIENGKQRYMLDLNRAPLSDRNVRIEFEKEKTRRKRDARDNIIKKS